MISGVTLSLMIGAGYARPVSKEMIEALESVRVTTSTEGPSVFQLRFRLPNRSPLHTLFLISGGLPIPLVRVIVSVTFRGRVEVLIDGVMTNHQISPADETHSILTVIGEDLSRVMDYIDFSGIPYPAMPREARVLLVVGKYAFLGIIPKIIPSVLIDVPIPTNRIPAHRGKDLFYVKKLAEEVGYVFYVEPGPTPGVNFAYWGPQLRVGPPQKALNLDMDAHRNVESISFRYDSTKKKLPILIIQEELTKAPIPIPIPDITPLSPPLGAIPPIPMQFELIAGSAKYGPVAAAAIGLAKAAKSSAAVFGQGTLDVLRYGEILKARNLVGVRGVGPAFDGLYYVESVTHDLKRGSYKQSFQLSRNALVSTVDRVPA